MNWQNSVSMASGNFQCPQVDSFVIEKNRSKISPIDAFYKSTNDILTITSPHFINEYGEEITGLLFVGLISATENYFRDVLGVILSICPISQIHSADEKIQLGSLLWGNKELHNRSAFEFMAFSNGKNVKDTFNNFTRHVIRQNGVWNSMLPEYDKLCEFRHAVVHSGHIIAGKNAVKLRLRSSKRIMKLSIDYGRMQAAGRVCTAFVQAANNELFELMVERWAVEWRRHSSWSPLQEDKIKAIYETFLSKRDVKNGTVTNHLLFADFVASVKQAYSL